MFFEGSLFSNQVVWGIDGLSVKEPKSLSTVVEPLVHLSLPLSKHRWVTSAIPLHSPIASVNSVNTTGSDPPCWLVCGDRKGSLHVYQTNLTSQPSQAKEVTNFICCGKSLIVRAIFSPSTYNQSSHCLVFTVSME